MERSRYTYDRHHLSYSSFLLFLFSLSVLLFLLKLCSSCVCVWVCVCSCENARHATLDASRLFAQQQRRTHPTPGFNTRLLSMTTAKKTRSATRR